MSDSYLVLGQVYPAGGTVTSLYASPANTETTVSTIMVCNVTTFTDTFSIAVVPGGASPSTVNYIYNNLAMDAADNFSVTAGITLAPTDTIYVESANGHLTFSAFGIQIS